MEPVPHPSFEETFAATESGEVELAMIPIENSLGGRAADIGPGRMYEGSLTCGPVSTIFVPAGTSHSG